MLRRGCTCLVSGGSTAAAAHAPIASTSRRALTSAHLPQSAFAPPRLPTRRSIHTTPSSHLPRSPRSLRGSSTRRWTDEDDVGAADAKPNTASADSDTPWFLQQEEVIEEDAEGESDRPSSDATEDTTLDAFAANPPLPADLPETLRLMHRHLTLGPVAGLLYKRTFDDDHEPDYPSLEFFNSKNTKNVVNWCDWIVFVTVRENNGGNINARVAEDVSEILKRAGPPTAEEMIDEDRHVNLDDLLGPNQQTSGTRSPFGPLSKQSIDAEKLKRHDEKWQAMQASQAADEAFQAQRSQSSPTWARHRDTLKKKFADSQQGTTNWRPRKILSRETQSGMRILHNSDPRTHTTESLAAQFKISPEAVRRILKADPAKWGGDSIEDKGARRYDPQTGHWMVRTGPERWVREDEEIERLRQSMANDQEGEAAFEEDEHDEDEDNDDDMDPPPPSAQTPLLELRSLGKPRHPVRIEGGPLSSLASKTRNKRIAKRATFGGGSIGDTSRGDSAGEWILVDAGWCVVHVMTPKSREKYRLEDVWKKSAAQGGFEDLEIG